VQNVNSSWIGSDSGFLWWRQWTAMFPKIRDCLNEMGDFRSTCHQSTTMITYPWQKFPLINQISCRMKTMLVITLLNVLQFMIKFELILRLFTTSIVEEWLFYSEDRGSRFLRSFATYLPNYRAFHPTNLNRNTHLHKKLDSRIDSVGLYRVSSLAMSYISHVKFYK
jgi:hypothetical protein